MEPVPGLAWQAASVNLEFRDASPQHSGLYLCVVYVNDHIHAWGHITISTAAQYRNAVVEQPSHSAARIWPSPPTRTSGPLPTRPQPTAPCG